MCFTWRGGRAFASDSHSTSARIGAIVLQLLVLGTMEFAYRSPKLAFYCLANVSGPVFVTVPNSPLEVISVVPASELPLTLP